MFGVNWALHGDGGKFRNCAVFKCNEQSPSGKFFAIANWTGACDMSTQNK